MRDVVTIDTHYLGEPGLAAAYLLVEGDRAAFVENNTTHAVPRLLAALKDAGLGPEQVDYAVVTHAHLDHAGGSSALLEACPQATLLCHPRAARHLADPTKLVASASAVYGAERFRKLYGEIEPIPAQRIRALDDGERVMLGGGRELFFFHTRGHANHHLCVHDSGSNGIFTGDAFGLTYPRLQSGGLYSFPTTSPTDFMPGEARAVIEQIAARRPDRVYPTHFGEQRDVQGIAAQLLQELAFSTALYEETKASPLEGRALEEFCEERMNAHFRERLDELGLPSDGETWAFLALDRELNAQGIAFAAQRARKA